MVVRKRGEGRDKNEKKMIFFPEAEKKRLNRNEGTRNKRGKEKRQVM